MTEIKLTKAEARILTDAAGQEGRITFPSSMKPSATERLVGRLMRDRLAIVAEDHQHRLSPTGYLAIGLKPPRANSGSKKALVVELLQREDGASLAELISATGWLPHTTRAALSRLRSSGQALSKQSHSDGTTAYRLARDERASAPPRGADRTTAAQQPTAVA